MLRNRPLPIDDDVIQPEREGQLLARGGDVRSPRGDPVTVGAQRFVAVSAVQIGDVRRAGNDFARNDVSDSFRQGAVGLPWEHAVQILAVRR